VLVAVKDEPANKIETLSAIGAPVRLKGSNYRREEQGRTFKRITPLFSLLLVYEQEPPILNLDGPQLASRDLFISGQHLPSINPY
jgi:hypothetical protein